MRFRFVETWDLRSSAGTHAAFSGVAGTTIEKVKRMKRVFPSSVYCLQTELVEMCCSSMWTWPWDQRRLVVRVGGWENFSCVFALFAPADIRSWAIELPLVMHHYGQKIIKVIVCLV